MDPRIRSNFRNNLLGEKGCAGQAAILQEQLNKKFPVSQYPGWQVMQVHEDAILTPLMPTNYAHTYLQMVNTLEPLSPIVTIDPWKGTVETTTVLPATPVPHDPFAGSTSIYHKIDY